MDDEESTQATVAFRIQVRSETQTNIVSPLVSRDNHSISVQAHIRKYYRIDQEAPSTSRQMNILSEQNGYDGMLNNLHTDIV